MPDGMQQQPMHMNPQMQQPVPTQPQAQVRGGREVGGGDERSGAAPARYKKISALALKG